VKRFLLFLAIAIALLVEAGCGGGTSNVSGTMLGPQLPAPDGTVIANYDSIPHFDHVALVIFENQELEKSLDNSNMPWLSNLAHQNAYASNYFADTHPSLPNYFMLTTGQLVTNSNDFGGEVDGDNIVREMVAAGKSWKAYEESIPSPGYLSDKGQPYEKTHDPAAYFIDVRRVPQQAANLVPLTQLQTDMAAGTLPNFMFIEPNQVNSMHDCPVGNPGCDNNFKLTLGDNWAKQNLEPLLTSPAFKNGLLIITWDESWDTDNRNGGGRVAMILVGPGVKTQYVSATAFQHESTLRLICNAVEIPCMGNSLQAPPMTEFFTVQ
jgi:acid phosphatase